MEARGNELTTEIRVSGHWLSSSLVDWSRIFPGEVRDVHGFCVIRERICQRQGPPHFMLAALVSVTAPSKCIFHALCEFGGTVNPHTLRPCSPSACFEVTSHTVQFFLLLLDLIHSLGPSSRLNFFIK